MVSSEFRRSYRALETRKTPDVRCAMFIPSFSLSLLEEKGQEIAKPVLNYIYLEIFTEKILVIFFMPKFKRVFLLKN